MKETKMQVHFSSNTDLWATPQEFFDKYNSIYNFDIDVCANKENAKVSKFFTKEDDALVQEWSGVCWMNPPYGRTIGEWMKKAYEESQRGALVVWGVDRFHGDPDSSCESGLP